MEQKVAAFLETQGLLGDVFSYNFKKELVKTGPMNTAVLELKVGHDKLGVMRNLSYDDLRLCTFKGHYITHHSTREVYERHAGGFWYPAAGDSPDGSGTSTGSTSHSATVSPVRPADPPADPPGQASSPSISY